MVAPACHRSRGRPALGRPALGALPLLLLCPPALGEMRPPKQLSEKGLHAAWRYLTHKDLDLLGDWRFDKKFLVDLNKRLVDGQVGVINNFFVQAFADMLHNESVQLVAWGTNFGDPFENTPLGPLGVDAYDKHFDPGERCLFVDQTYALARGGAFFRYNVLEQPKGKGRRSPAGGPPSAKGVGHDRLRPEELPGRLAVQKLFRHRKWIKGWTILLTGTDKGVDGLSMSDPYFREYRAGDYINIHTDVVRQRQNVRRRLCFNYWTPSPGWDSAWGGSFVWCGGFVKRPGGGGAFPAAFRAPTRYNQVGMFVPSEDSRHFVDRVSDAADPSHHRFSFTSWLEDTTPPPGSEEL